MDYWFELYVDILVGTTTISVLDALDNMYSWPLLVILVPTE
jgi:hypothetical protein